MKYLVKNCVFSAVAKTVTFPVQITQDRLLLITNTTRNRIIYNFADPLTGGVMTGNVLALVADTAGMQDDDALQVYAEDGISQDEALTRIAESMSELALAIRRLQVVAPLPDPTGRVRAAIETGSLSLVSTVSNISNVTSVNGFAGYSSALVPFSVMQCAVNGLRSKIDLS